MDEGSDSDFCPIRAEVNPYLFPTWAQVICWKETGKQGKVTALCPFSHFLLRLNLQNLAEELRETEQQLSKLDEGRKNNMIAICDLEMTKERLLSFAEYAKDAQLEVLVTLIQTIVERIYIVDKDDERFCHIFIKGCADEGYTGFFQTAGYIEQNTTPVCDSEQYCIDNIFFTYVFIRHFFPPLSRLYQSESELIHFFESKFLDESEVIHSGAYTNLYAYPL